MMRACEPPRTWEMCLTAFRDTFPPPHVCGGVFWFGCHFWLCSESEEHTYLCALAFVVAVVARLRGAGRSQRVLRGRRPRVARSSCPISRLTAGLAAWPEAPRRFSCRAVW